MGSRKQCLSYETTCVFDYVISFMVSESDSSVNTYLLCLIDFSIRRLEEVSHKPRLFVPVSHNMLFRYIAIIVKINTLLQRSLSLSLTNAK